MRILKYEEATAFLAMVVSLFLLTTIVCAQEKKD
jgi:hypothetical protein